MKKLLGFIIIILITINIYSVSFAIDESFNNNYKLLMPTENIVTSENTILLSGKAKVGSNVDISVYNYDHISNIDELVKNTKFKTKLKVGELERFNIELELPLGRNKIIVDIKNNGRKYVFERIINITDNNIAKKYIENISILNNNKRQILKSIIEKK